ncbi:homoserine kinase [Rhodocaloribacter litoris]|uniref:homoserine kinase n=1 Tax=Rhodocaloribacter litoris TaxID=2558931 RepID=UPI00142450AB|nr:homoserine kinase [Rhodocaloribacter litoris]QXD15336.1 homoserine kinase [Rhodocaloribacter litoris]
MGRIEDRYRTAVQTERSVIDALRPVGEAIAVRGPASLSNLGPGFDAVGLCLDGWGDVIEARVVEEPGVHLLPGEGAVAWTPPPSVAENTAGMAAHLVMQRLGVEGGLALRIHKGIPPGSGLGSSAASAVAGAWAANVAFGGGLEKTDGDLIEAVLEGETVASGSRHGDNVLPALLGGLVLVDPDDPARHRRVGVPPGLSIAVILPQVQVLTKAARAILPQEVPLRDAVRNAAAFAFLVDAFRAGDWETVGRCIMADRLVEPVRAPLVPCYEAVRRAALDAGACGCALSGSGPALFALTGEAGRVEAILQAMLEASRNAGIPARGFVSGIDDQGARAVR